MSPSPCVSCRPNTGWCQTPRPGAAGADAPAASPAAWRHMRSRNPALFQPHPQAICYVMIIELSKGNFREMSFSAEGIE